jgi:pre-mRNA-processing factor 17
MESLKAYESETEENDDSDDDNNDDKVPDHDNLTKNIATSRTTSNVVTEQQQQQHEVPAPSVRVPDRQMLLAAPSVSLKAGRSVMMNQNSTALTVTEGGGVVANSRKRSASGLILMNNPTKDIMYRPVQGPYMSDPNHKNKSNNGRGSSTEVNVAYDDLNFSEQRTAFQRDGIAHAPVADGNQLTYRTTIGYTKDRIQKMMHKEQNRPDRPINNTENTVLVEGSDDETDYGIWGPPSAEERYEKENTLSMIQKGDTLDPLQVIEREYIAERNRQRGIEEQQNQEETTYDRIAERKMAHLLPPVMNQNNKIIEDFVPSTIFHGSEEYDYKGRSWMAPPAGLGAILVDSTPGRRVFDPDHHVCKIPKKCVHRFTGHNQGVHRIRLFPLTGHLLLSAGLDGKCKIWSIALKQVMRTYLGHTAAVRDVQFNHTGTQFISASFDRTIQLWDTESGKVLQTFTNRKVPYVLQYYPKDDHYFVVGCSDNKIVTYDTRTGDITQEYNHHLGPVNSIIFLEDQQGTTKMITSSDDKKILVWEWDIGVPIKYISDPTMHSIPSLLVHPSKPFFIGQSLDNTIVVFTCHNGRYALQKKSKYSGHIISGYACEMSISPDGQYLCSGDGNGNFYIWDWKTHRIIQKYQAHTNGPTICTIWHPIEPSTLFTCGWDGIIKMWQ